MIALYVNNSNISESIVMEKVKAQGGFNQTIREEYMRIMGGKIIDAIHEACGLLLNYSMKRRIGDIATDAITSSNTKEELEYPEIIEEVVNKLTALNSVNSSETESIGDEYMNTIDDLERGMEAVARGEIPGVYPGFKNMMNTMGSLKGNNLIILAARPSQGKTSFALSQLIEMAKCGIPVAFISLEMDKGQILQRGMARETGVPLNKIKEYQLNRAELDRIKQESYNFYNMPLILDDDSTLNMSMFRSKLRRYIKEYGVRYIVIDYLQLMSGPANLQSREREVAYITRSMKKLSKQYNIPIMLLCQLNRDVEKRKGDESAPRLSDLRESGSIEQDADVVMFVHNSNIIVAKNRQGAIGTINGFIYDKSLTSFICVSN
jgi:replicative DNA helicase